jgi:putative secretion ATPase (PEP-CTERM system associated)
MYESFYNLRAEPFRLSPDHRFCFTHRSYSKAKAYMQYAYQRAEGFVMITGRPGTGKSTLIRDLISTLSDNKSDVAMLVCTQLEANDLLRMVAHAFKTKTVGEDKSTILQNLGRKLALNFNEGCRSLLIIDEAQDLSLSALEELRLLTNLQIKNKPLLQIFLLGQPELRDMIQNPRMEQVHQRIVAACHLEPLKEPETKNYILHRLTQVGWDGRLQLSEAIYPVIYKFSEGIPRRINLICSRLLLHGSVEELWQIGINDIKEVIEELQHEQLTASDIYSDMDFIQEDSFTSLAGLDEQGSSGKKKVNAGLALIEDSDHHKKAVFDARERQSDKPAYTGIERRREHRRKAEDRREHVRFEPNKADRRSRPGRRKGDISKDIWTRFVE